MTATSGEQAVKNGRAHKTYDSGMCQKYVRDPCWRVPSLFGSAIEAWNGARDKHPGDRTPPVGAPCYYRGGNYGHAVICVGDGRIRSTDCTSAYQVSEVPIAWVEDHWGYVYLGWTGDLNGVDLPLGSGGGGEDEVKDEDIEAIAHRVNMALGDYTADGKKRDGVKDPEQANKRLTQIENKLDRLLEKS